MVGTTRVHCWRAEEIRLITYPAFQTEQVPQYTYTRPVSNRSELRNYEIVLRKVQSWRCLLSVSRQSGVGSIVSIM